jgi:hypothetical protein
MSGETNLALLLKTLKPTLYKGDYVFCVIPSLQSIDFTEIIASFQEEEGLTVIIRKELADQLKLLYPFIAAWITLTIHSSLEAVGLTAAFSNALSQAGISCNVMAAYHHNHIFVNRSDAQRAMAVLEKLSE